MTAFIDEKFYVFVTFYKWNELGKLSSSESFGTLGFRGFQKLFCLQTFMDIFCQFRKQQGNK